MLLLLLLLLGWKDVLKVLGLLPLSMHLHRERRATGANHVCV